MPSRTPALPPLVHRKLYKTGQSRGATLNEIYQNRVLRNNTVLIDWDFLDACREPHDGTAEYENGSLILVDPRWYYETGDSEQQLAMKRVVIGINALLLFKRKTDWDLYHDNGGHLKDGRPLRPATMRRSPLGGNFFARIHATTAQDDDVIRVGFDSRELRGAGIRVYEYASASTIKLARSQLEYLLWRCDGAIADMVDAGMELGEARARRDHALLNASSLNLDDDERLHAVRAIGANGLTNCPLCLEPIRAIQFLDRSAQAEGRAVEDLTVTDVTLFHIQELRVGTLQHKPYNLGWGHLHCNTVTRDAGIMPTLKWMKSVIANQPADLDRSTASVEEAIAGD